MDVTWFFGFIPKDDRAGSLVDVYDVSSPAIYDFEADAVRSQTYGKGGPVTVSPQVQSQLVADLQLAHFNLERMGRTPEHEAQVTRGQDVVLFVCRQERLEVDILVSTTELVVDQDATE